MGRIAECAFFLLAVFFVAAMFQKPKAKVAFREGNPFRGNRHAEYLLSRSVTAGAKGLLFFAATIFFVMGLATELALDIH